MKTPTRIAMIAALAAAFLAAGGRDPGSATNGPAKDHSLAAEVHASIAPDPILHAQLASNLPGRALSVER